jgi:hypothetical protein
VTQQTPRLRLYRRLVFRTTSSRAFARYLSDAPLHVEDLTPRDGERISGPPASISGKVLNVDQIVLETAMLHIDKFGSQPFEPKIDSQTGAWRVDLPTTTKHGYFFVNLSAKDRVEPNRWRATSWLFIVKRNRSKT